MRRSNGYQQQHHYGSGGHYNSNRYEYGAFNPNLNNRNDENGFKRSRSAYEGSYNSTNSYENSFYDSLSNKKLRRDWYVMINCFLLKINKTNYLKFSDNFNCSFLKLHSLN